MNALARVAAAVLLIAATPANLLAAYDVDWHTVDAGGGRSTGAGYELLGTIGQSDAAPAAGAGGITVQGGYWSGVTMADEATGAIFQDQFE